MSALKSSANYVLPTKHNSKMFSEFHYCEHLLVLWRFMYMASGEGRRQQGNIKKHIRKTSVCPVLWSQEVCACVCVSMNGSGSSDIMLSTPVGSCNCSRPFPVSHYLLPECNSVLCGQNTLNALIMTKEKVMQPLLKRVGK